MCRQSFVLLCCSMEFGEDFPNQIAPFPYNAIADLMPIDEVSTTTQRTRSSTILVSSFIGLEPYYFICNILEMDTIIFIKLFRSAFVNDHFVRFLVVQRKLRSFICELSFISIYYILFLTERSFSKNYRFLQFIQFFHNFVWKLVHFVHSFFSFNQMIKKWFIYSVTHP